MQEQKSKWVKFGAIFAILIMVGSVFFIFGSVDWGNLIGGSNKTTEFPLSDVSGTKANFTFKNAIDGSKYLPEGALNITIQTISPNDVFDQELQTIFPGIEADRHMRVMYSSGYVDYFSLSNGSNASIILNESRPQYDSHEGYNIIFKNPSQRVVAGNPIILASFFNYAIDNSLARKVVDVLSGKSSGSTDFDDILSYADNTEIYNGITMFKASEESNYSKYYQRSSHYENGTFQLETIILNPEMSMKEDIEAFSDNGVESVTVSITENGPAMKIYITGTDYIPFATKANELYNLASNHSA